MAVSTTSWTGRTSFPAIVIPTLVAARVLVVASFVILNMPSIMCRHLVQSARSLVDVQCAKWLRTCDKSTESKPRQVWRVSTIFFRSRARARETLAAQGRWRRLPLPGGHLFWAGSSGKAPHVAGMRAVCEVALSEARVR